MFIFDNATRRSPLRKQYRCYWSERRYQQAVRYEGHPRRIISALARAIVLAGYVTRSSVLLAANDVSQSSRRLRATSLTRQRCLGISPTE